MVASVTAVAGLLACVIGFVWACALAVALGSGRVELALVVTMGWVPLLMIAVGALGVRSVAGELRRTFRWLDRRHA